MDDFMIGAINQKENKEYDIKARKIIFKVYWEIKVSYDYCSTDKKLE